MAFQRSYTSKQIWAAIAFAVVLFMVSLAVPLGSYADGVVRLFYFYDPNCAVCQETHQQVLEPLLAEYGERIAVDERDMSVSANFEFLLGLEKQFGVVGASIPEVFIAQDALIGPEAIRERLRERIDHYLTQGGVDLPATPPAVVPTPTAECKECPDIHAAQRTAVANRQTPTLPATATPALADKPRIHVAWFYQPGCDLCERKEHDLQYIVDKYSQVSVRRFNIKEEAALNEYLCLRAHVPEDRHMIAPAFFVGGSAVVGNEITGSSIEALLRPYLATGAAEPWLDWEAQKETAEQRILARFRSLGLWTVVGAGLLDGINPCAFATMIFLISYLSVRKRRGRELLATGAAFTLGVFLAYLGVGLGFLKFLTAVPALEIIGKWIYALTLVLCLGLAWGSFKDYLKAREGRLEDMSLKLPERLRGWTHRLIREGSRARNYVAASLVLGFVVSIVELACTGQVYLPTIIFVLGLPEWRVRAVLALLVYNLMFIVPLVVVFLLVYRGTTSKQLLEWMNRRAAAVKLGTAALFLLLAVWLGYSLAVL